MRFNNLFTFSNFLIIATNIQNAATIVSGKVAAKDEFGWIVNILRGGDLICGGSLIDWDVVLTAAHCFVEKDTGTAIPIEELIVVAGDYNVSEWEETEQPSTVLEVQMHDKFENTSWTNDIAWVKLSHKFESTEFVKLIYIQSFDFFHFTDTAEVAGWGQTYTSSFSDVLLKAEILIEDKHKCNITDEQFQVCAGVRGVDTCEGDSGGPLMCRDHDGTMYLCGITSYGYSPCGDKPAIYTNVHGYLEWITKDREPKQMKISSIDSTATSLRIEILEIAWIAMLVLMIGICI